MLVMVTTKKPEMGVCLQAEATKRRKSFMAWRLWAYYYDCVARNQVEPADNERARSLDCVMPGVCMA